MTDRELFEIAKKAEKNAYTPYSKFNVGAALLCKDGTVFTGCNIENASYPATICAERTAMSKAISEGYREFSKIMITSSGGTAWPCGICRQFMNEFCGADFVIMTGTDIDHIESRTMEELLPKAFKL